MKKLEKHSLDITQNNIEKIKAMFPGCITETQDANGDTRLGIDFDKLRLELNSELIEERQERYQLDWPGKSQALVLANTPTTSTLRPDRENSVNFDDTKNLFIEGDNLVALKLLQKSYSGRVKMIYIDPPYNTGKDFIYEDNFSESTESYLQRSNQVDDQGNRLVVNRETNGRFHSDWLSMIYPRLKLARNLLKRDGIIFISIDDYEAHNLRKVCDEVFGASNFVAQLVWERAYSPKNNSKSVSRSHDYILMYAKDNEDFQLGRLPRTTEANDRYKNRDNDPRGAWKPGDFSVKGSDPKKEYPITIPSGRVVTPSVGRCWMVTKEAFEERVKNNLIWFGADGNSAPSTKRFLSELKSEGMAPTSILHYKKVGHSQEGVKEVVALFEGETHFDSPKPVRLLKHLITMANLEANDIIVDFFAGSGSTAHAIMQKNAEEGTNCSFILVQLPEEINEDSKAHKQGYHTISELSQERIRRAGVKIIEEESNEGWNKDIGFRVLRIDQSSFMEVIRNSVTYDKEAVQLSIENIKADRSAEDLVFQVMIDWGLEPSFPIQETKIMGKTVYLVEENALVACFDKDIDEQLITELTKMQPLRVVFRDHGFASDSIKINSEQIFKQLSPHTNVRSI